MLATFLSLLPSLVPSKAPPPPPPPTTTFPAPLPPTSCPRAGVNYTPNNNNYYNYHPRRRSKTRENRIRILSRASLSRALARSPAFPLSAAPCFSVQPSYHRSSRDSGFQCEIISLRCFLGVTTRRPDTTNSPTKSEKTFFKIKSSGHGGLLILAFRNAFLACVKKDFY